MSTLTAARERTARYPWVWSFLAMTVMWISIGAVAGGGFTGTFTSTLSFAPYLVLVGIGQMLVITLGYGHIDLSVPYVMTLAGFVSTAVMDTGQGSLALGLLAALACGLGAGLVNAFGILALSIPPIVVTLATGLMAASAAAVWAGNFAAAVDPRLHGFVAAQLGPVPLLALICIGVAVVAGFVLHRTPYGRSLQAIGQNPRAAEFAGISYGRHLAVTFVACALLASLSGTLLAAYTSPSLGIGDPYLLNSVAVVVLGGTLISGGRSNVPGVWGGTLFLILLVTLLNVLNINVAVQNIIKGLLIIAVLSLIGAKKER